MITQEKAIGTGWKEAERVQKPPMENRAGEGMKWQTLGS